MEKAKAFELVRWVAENVEPESGFLYPNPEWYVPAKLLLDKMCKLFGLDKKDVGEVVKETALARKD